MKIEFFPGRGCVVETSRSSLNTLRLVCDTAAPRKLPGAKILCAFVPSWLN
jgi:hypothetical protein